VNIKHDKALDIATGNSRKTKAWKNKPVKWSELLSRLENTTRTPETVAEYKAMSRDQQSDIKDVGGFVGGTVKGVSLLLGTINLLPLAPLDGGRILSALLTPVCGSEVCRVISDFCSLILLALLWVLSLYIFFYSGINCMLLLFCSYLFSYIVLKKL
jgi:hypothetical protein